LVKSREAGWRTYNRPIDVLLLCTANQCRSPMAEALLRRRLHDAGVDARVSSAGLYPSGNPATEEAISVMASRGLDIEPHRSRQVEPGMVRSADLVLGMAREHVREVAVLDGAALARTFTLKELVTSGRNVGPRRSGESLEAWLARAGTGRRRQSLLGAGHDDALDVADPVGSPKSEYVVTADELEGLLDELVGLVWPAGVIDEARGRTA
jgi:protein-tyrosine phosphatase